MNKKRTRVLLLTIAFVFVVALQLGVEGAFAGNAGLIGQGSVPATKHIGPDAVPLAKSAAESATDQTAASKATQDSVAERVSAVKEEADQTATQDQTAESAQESKGGLATEAPAGSTSPAASDAKCQECGKTGGHTETCSHYGKESASYPWAVLNDADFVAWLMDEANAETIKGILTSEGEEYDALKARINEILDGDDTELAQQVQEYLTALTGMDEPETQVKDEYIYFDLAAGDVTIGKDWYQGYVFTNYRDERECIEGVPDSGSKYYIYQSTDAEKGRTERTTGYATWEDISHRENCRIPTYNRVAHGGELWTEYITNNTKVKEVSENWDIAAGAAHRKSTNNHITFKSESNYTADVTIDNIWSTYIDQNSNPANRTTGGITANLSNTGIRCEDVHIRLRLKGDNRVSCVHYSAAEDARNTIEFYDGKATSDESGSITVADFKDNWRSNHWSSVIGGADNPAGVADKSDGIVIKGGVIYAGATPEDNCTAIGGGGNDYGGVTIDGGMVTAVTAGTGTAIGGGIGYSNAGGNTNVTINDGIVYAYNLGINTETDKASGGFGKFVPAAAIGGGGSKNSAGGLNAEITITGGTIYAQSVGGPAIGGGGSANNTGGPATITIEGGDITAKSIPGTYGKTPIPAAVSIGGGTGDTGGGSVKLDISGGIIRTGSIGGGLATGEGKPLGSATVEISGGDTKGQVIMQGGATKNCSFTMTAGKLHGTDVTTNDSDADVTIDDREFYYLEENGGAVWIEDEEGVATVSGGSIYDCTAELGGAIYMEGGTFTLSGDGVIQNNKALRDAGVPSSGNGGGVYVTGGTANVQGGSLSGNKAQVRGGGLYVTGQGEKAGAVNVSGGSINGNVAGFAPEEDAALPADAGRGGGAYLEGGLFTMTGGTISKNHANYRGGGIFLTKSPALNGGTVSDNTANDSGGGLCVNGDKLELKSPTMEIYGNTAANGGGAAVLNGEFVLNGGAVGVEGAVFEGESQEGSTAKKANKATDKGGGVYVKAESSSTSTDVGAETAADAGTNSDAGGGVDTDAKSKASATVLNGNIWYNEAAEGGGVYLAQGEGDFKLEGADAVVSHNKATYGGGVYLYKNPILNQGKIDLNAATENGGGMFISDCRVMLRPTGEVTIANNTAQNGAGIHIHDSSSVSGSTESSGAGNTDGNAVDAVSSTTPIPNVGLRIEPDYAGQLVFENNTATKNGGAVCVDAGRFQLESDRATIIGNSAKNGGGVAVLHGNFTMTTGSIGEKDRAANTATNGGGVYVTTGEVWLKGGSVRYNEATNGGGAYVTDGKFTMMDGSLEKNTATENGGGGYVAGDFRMQGGTVGGVGSGNTAKNGGGVYVNDGSMAVVYGDISHNVATQDGGGFYISATNETPQVEMLSGSLSYNQADKNGGGMAVESNNARKIDVKVGCLLNHDLAGGNGKPNYSIEYTGTAYGAYAEFGGQAYAHDSCPKVEHNNAKEIGGGFYMNSDAATLSFFCVEETNNTAKGKDATTGMEVDGGKVVIGDEYYHNHIHDKDQPGKHVVPWGYISMDDATLVNGGQVDIYGDMTNPVFKNEVTVDIEDTANDHFMDHRRAYDNEKNYKVHYFENFQDAGLYQAFQYDEAHAEIAIEGALYSHDGYRILGWCTQPERDDRADNNYYYEVGTKVNLAGNVDGMGIHSINCSICGDAQQDKKLLELYAIWEPNTYTVRFDPNVPVGDSYTGIMADQPFTYDKEQKLRKNEYDRPGYFFTGWNTKPDGEGNAYGDEANGHKFATKQGAVVTLYAQWQECDHKDPGRWSYHLSEENENTLIRDCSCGGQTLTATLSAADTVYDGNPHPATLTVNDEAAWDTDKPTVEYTSEWINDIHPSNEANLLDSDGKPLHAGIYTATIKKTGQNDVAESKIDVEYTIAKADQSAPAKPTYEVPTGANKVIVNKIADKEIEDAAGRKHTAAAEYCLTYYSGDQPQSTRWTNQEDPADKIPITMETAWTSYNVEARYKELDDYNASEVVRADATYHYAGEVEVRIVCDEGIEARFEPLLANDKLNGATLTLSIMNGYYRVGDSYSVTSALQQKDGKPATDSVSINSTTSTDDRYSKYSVTGVPDNHILTITIGTARKTPQVEAQVAPGQKFASFTNAGTTISRDSAFTAAFKVSNFDPHYTDDANASHGTYDTPKLTFASKEIPSGTTIILLNRKDGSYWYYRADAATSEVSLADFTKMGDDSDTHYEVPHSVSSPSDGSGSYTYVDLDYQFIVDFSQTEAGYPEDSNLTMTLEAPKNAAITAAGIPEVKQGVSVSLKNSAFDLDATSSSGLTNSFTCTFAKDGGADASKWDDRASALVLTPNSGTDLPPDAQIKAKIGDQTTYLYKTLYKSEVSNDPKDSFIVPLSLLKTGGKTVELTLESALFPAVARSYDFTVEWLISPSEASKAPMIGDQGAKLESVKFTSAKHEEPSLKSTSTQRVLAENDTLNLAIESKNIYNHGYTISAALLRKSEGSNYIETGWRSSVSGDTLGVPLSGQRAGSLCLMLTVQKADTGTAVMEVPYYFVIKKAS